MSTLAKEKVYFVRHADWGLAVVTAVTPEEATVAAAKFWGAPWGKIAWQCEIERTLPIFNNICSRCGGMFQGGHTAGTSLCDKCLQALREENLEKQRLERKREKIRAWEEKREKQKKQRTESEGRA